MVANTEDKPRRMGRPPLPPEFRLRRRLALLTADQCDRLREVSQAHGMSEAAFIRQAVEEKLDSVSVA